MDAILTVDIVMIALDDYIIEVLMRDLVGHDRRPVSLTFATRVHFLQKPLNLGAISSKVFTTTVCGPGYSVSLAARLWC